MVKVAGSPIITHIMRHYIKFGFNDFIIATGYDVLSQKYLEVLKKTGLPFKTKIFKKILYNNYCENRIKNSYRRKIKEG